MAEAYEPSVSWMTMYLTSMPSAGRFATWPFDGSAATNVQSTVAGHSVAGAAGAARSFSRSSCAVAYRTDGSAASRIRWPSVVCRRTPVLSPAYTRSAKVAAALRSGDWL